MKLTRNKEPLTIVSGETESKRDTARERLFTELLERRPPSSEIPVAAFQDVSIASPLVEQALEPEQLRPLLALEPASELLLASAMACQFAVPNHRREHEQCSHCSLQR
jgi:hypothetical protein